MNSMEKRIEVQTREKMKKMGEVKETLRDFQGELEALQRDVAIWSDRIQDALEELEEVGI